MIRKPLMLLLFSLFVLTGCAINPVTGQREIAIVSEGYELNIGQEQYGPSRQMQGGDYTVDPELTAYVNRVGQKLASVSDRQLPYEFVVLNNSIPNAWALPGGKLAINRGLLLELNSEAELAAVLGHEIVHAAARHGAKGMERGILLQGALLATGIAFAGHEYANQVVGGAQLAATLVNQKYSRDAEREADYYGMIYMSRAGYDLQAAVTLQETFVRLSENQRQDWLSGLFSSHPPSQERVDANRQTAYMLSSKGIMGTETYQKAIAHLKQTQPAYQACDEARKALSENNVSKADTLVKKALKIEPREALFYALMGDINVKKNQLSNALDSYTQAIARNNHFFYYFLQRGLIRSKLDDRKGAKSDLEQSIGMLPTAAAYNALGNIAQAEGDRTMAMKYFQGASGSDSESGQQARNSLTRLDLPLNPNNYFKIQTGIDSNRMLFTNITNTTNFSVRNIRIQIRYQDAFGRIQESIRNLPSGIPPGSMVSAALGIGPINDPAFLNTLQVLIINAAVDG